MANNRGYKNWLYWKEYKKNEVRIKIHFEILYNNKYGIVKHSRSVKTSGKSVAMYSLNLKNISKFRDLLGYQK